MQRQLLRAGRAPSAARPCAARRALAVLAVQARPKAQPGRLPVADLPPRPATPEPGQMAPLHASMPRLPPHKPGKAGSGNCSEQPPGSSKAPASVKASAGGKQAGPSGDSPFLPPPPDDVQQKALAGLLAFIGLTGCTAVGISLAAQFAGLDFDLWANTHLTGSGPQDILLGLQLMAPAMALNTLILWPNYSSWTLPADDEQEPGQQQQRQQQQQQQPEPAVLAAEPSALQLVRQRAKDALFLSQGRTLSQQPALVLPPPLAAAVLAADCLAAELLYRSVTLQLAGGWLSDRLAEAGLDDWLEALTSPGLPALPTALPGQLLAVALLGGAWGITVARRMAKVSRRAPLLGLAGAGKRPAGRLLADVRRAAVLRKEAADKQQQAAQQPASSSSISSATTSSTTTTTTTSGTSSSSSSTRSSSSSSSSEQPGAAPPPSRQAADLALAAAAAVREQEAASQWARRLPSTLSALALSELVQGSRDIAQMVGLGLAFALTGGNLAAPIAASCANTALLAVLQKRGQERARKRSVAIAKHFAAITRQMRELQRKKAAEQAAAADAAAAAAGSEPHGAAAVAAAAAAEGARADAVAAAAAMPQGVMAMTPQAAEPADAPAAATRGGPHAEEQAQAPDVSSRMGRTLSVLDALLGEQVEVAASGKQ